MLSSGSDDSSSTLFEDEEVEVELLENGLPDDFFTCLEPLTRHSLTRLESDREHHAHALRSCIWASVMVAIWSARAIDKGVPDHHTLRPPIRHAMSVDMDPRKAYMSDMPRIGIEEDIQRSRGQTTNNRRIRVQITLGSGRSLSQKC
jgi:hypothetical protein